MKEVYLKDDNYIQISGWMLNELQLKGIELLLYALIHGFSQDGKSDYHGGLQYMALWTNSSKQGVIKALKSLLEKGLIDKSVSEQNGVQYARYWTLKSRKITRNTPVNLKPKQNESSQLSLPTQSTEFNTKQNESSQLSLPTQSTEFNGGSQLSLPNNTNINSLNSISKAETEKAERENELTKTIKSLFDNSLVMFSDDLIPKLLLLTQSLETRLLKSYIKYVFNLVQLQKPKKPQGMFYKFVLQNNTLNAFKDSLSGNNGNKVQTWICPVCGKTNNFYDDCSECGTIFNDRKNEQHLNIQRQIFKLPLSEKNKLKDELNQMIMSGKGFENYRKFLSAKYEIYKKYGISV